MKGLIWLTLLLPIRTQAGAGGCGSRDVHMVWVSEYHTSKHCFRCGAETKPARVGSEARKTTHGSSRCEKACARAFMSLHSMLGGAAERHTRKV